MKSLSRTNPKFLGFKIITCIATLNVVLKDDLICESGTIL